MSAELLNLKHDQSPSSQDVELVDVAGESDTDACVGLDMSLTTFTGRTLNGSSFTASTFHDAIWIGCQFNHCSFSACDMLGLSITGCTFSNCTFSKSKFKSSKLSGCTFTQCNWSDVNFDLSNWSHVNLLDCRGKRFTSLDLHGHQVDFTGSQFEDMELTNARIN